MGTNTILRLRSRRSLLGISPLNNPTPGAAAYLRPGRICSHERFRLSCVSPVSKNAQEIWPKRRKKSQTTENDGIILHKRLQTFKEPVGMSARSQDKRFPFLILHHLHPVLDHCDFLSASYRGRKPLKICRQLQR